MSDAALAPGKRFDAAKVSEKAVMIQRPLKGVLEQQRLNRELRPTEKY